MATLERAIAIAAMAHEGQVDKAGMPYVLHPLRMMLSVDTLGARMAARLNHRGRRYSRAIHHRPGLASSPSALVA